MLTKRQLSQVAIVLSLTLLHLLANAGSFSRPAPIVAAQSTGDKLSIPTPTPPGPVNWIGELTRETHGAAGPNARLLIRVIGRNEHPVRISTRSQVINTAYTGQKPDELGPDVVEFAGLTPGKYIVEPLELNVAFEVELKPFVETWVEFRLSPTPDTPTPVSTNIPAQPPTRQAIVEPTQAATLPPVPTSTPAIINATPTSAAAQSPSPLLPTPTAISQWLGTIESRTDTETEISSIVVSVTGIEGLPVRLHAADIPTIGARRCITGQEGVGQDKCIFNNLQPGRYTVEPEGLRVQLPVVVYNQEVVGVSFNIETLPPGVVGWQAKLHKNTNGIRAETQPDSIITIRVIGRPGQVIALHSRRGPDQFCEVVYNPVLGSLVCEFSQLGPGVYEIEAVATGARMSLFVDGIGEAEVEFAPTAYEAAVNTELSLPLVGQGARPRRPTATATLQPVAVVQVQPAVATATATDIPTVTPTPTPEFAWQGHIVETAKTGAGAIGVRAAGLKDHPVILRSGSWQSVPQVTGTKIELGEYATEFGGLAPGEYFIELVDLAEMSVNLEPGQFMLVEFRYDFIGSP